MLKTTLWRRRSFQIFISELWIVSKHSGETGQFTFCISNILIIPCRVHYLRLSLFLSFPCHFSAGHRAVCNHWKATGNIILLSLHVLCPCKQQQCKYSCLVLLRWWWWFLCGCVCLQGSRLDEQRCAFPPPLRVRILAQNCLFMA